MSRPQRELHYQVVPRFYREAGVDMFEHRVDASNVIGPRVASKADKQKHPELWAAHLQQLTTEEDAKIKRKR